MKILIIDDGKAGHLQQSHVVATLIMQSLVRYGAREPAFDILPVQISKAKRWVLECLATYLPTTSCIVGQYICREIGVIAKLMPDIIISCGRGASIISAFYRTRACVKVCILYPGSYAIKKFDLLIVPEHDSNKLHGCPNVINTKLALYLPSTVDRKIGAHHIGVLLGGGNRSYRYSHDTCRRIAQELVQLKIRTGARLYWSASRRTPEYLQCSINNEFHRAGQEHYQLENMSELLFTCDWVIVSADSISMISQVISHGCKVTVFTPPARISSTGKHDRFNKMLSARGLIAICNYDEIGCQEAPTTNEFGLQLHQCDVAFLQRKIEDLLQTHAIL